MYLRYMYVPEVPPIRYLLANKTGEGNIDGNSDLTLLTLGSTESRY